MFDVIERWAEQDPDRRALEFDGRSWTYAQLAARIRRAANMLRGCGVELGDKFAVLDRNHPACLELTFAASLVGAANVVLDHRLPGDALIKVLGDSGARVVVVGEEFVDVLDELLDELPNIGDVIVLDEDYESRLAAVEPINSWSTSTSDYPVLRLHASVSGEALTQVGLLEHLVGVGWGAATVAEPLTARAGVTQALSGLNAGTGTHLLRDPA